MTQAAVTSTPLPAALLSRVFDLSDDAYFEFDQDLRYRYLNDAAVRISGQARESHLGRTAEEVPPGFDTSDRGRAYRDALRDRIEARIESYFADRDRWYEVSLFPHEGGLLARLRDIQARKHAEARLEEMERRFEHERERLEQLFDACPAIVNFFEGPGHVFTFANRRFRELIPGADGFVGKPVREAQPEMNQQGIVALLDQVYTSGVPFIAREFEVAVALPGGGTSESYFDLVYQPIRQRDGSIEGVASFAYDITESVRARRSLEQVARREEAARKQAEEVSRTKDEFLSTLSHELRTPLNAVIGWSHLLRTGGVAEDQSERALETIERNARAQARLIDDLLDLGRIVQGKMVLSVGPVEMVRIIESAIESVRLAAELKGIRLQPVLDSHATIVGDGERLQQLIWNLVSNAIKFTPKGGRVQVRLRRAASYVEVVVADSGQGIELNFLPHVFDRFRQADNSITRRVGGLGLGLAISRSLVELHGGTITAQSDGPGLGATFTVRLPTAPLRADSVPTLIDSHAPPVPTFECPPSLRDLRVLVVDDEPDTRALLEYVLAQCEVHVTLASSAVEALGLLTRQPFDVLLSDIGMPEEDGLAFIRRVRQLPLPTGRIPALALTAYARSEDRTAALRSGFHMHLAKPIEPNELLTVVATLANNARRD